MWSSSQRKWLGPSSELMALSLALAPASWRCLALLAAAAILPLLARVHSPASIAKKPQTNKRTRPTKKTKKASLIVHAPVHSSTACHDRAVAACSCPWTTVLTGFNRAERPSFGALGAVGKGRNNDGICSCASTSPVLPGLCVAADRRKASPANPAPTPSWEACFAERLKL